MAGNADIEILLRARDEISHVLEKVNTHLVQTQKAAQDAHGPLSRVGDVMSGGLKVGAIAGGAALAGLTGALALTVKAAADAETVHTQLNAVLASTGGVAGVTKDAAEELADSLSKIAPFEDEAILSAENLLLTFTNIGSDIFPQVTETVLDMSQALGQDLKSSSIQVGKALQDPINGVTALRRVGVALSDEQEDLIKHMAAVGDVAGAQGVIMAELQKEFGGSARAAGQTFAGSLTILKTQLGNVAEEIGGAVLPALTPFVQEMARNIPAAMEHARPYIKSFVDILGIIGGTIGALISGHGFDVLYAKINEVFGPELGRLIGGAIEVFNSIKNTVVLVVQVIQKVFSGDLKGALDLLVGGFSEATHGIQDVIGEQLLPWLRAQIPVIAAALLEWGKEFVAWVSPMIPPLLNELLHLAGQLLDWIGEQAPPLLERFLAEWVPAAIAWVAQAAVQLLIHLPEILWTIATWIQNEGVPKAEAMFLKIAEAIVRGVLTGLATLGNQLGDAVRGAFQDAIDSTDWGYMFRSVGEKAAQGIIDGLKSVPIAAPIIRAVDEAKAHLQVFNPAIDWPRSQNALLGQALGLSFGVTPDQFNAIQKNRAAEEGPQGPRVFGASVLAGWENLQVFQIVDQMRALMDEVGRGSTNDAVFGSDFLAAFKKLAAAKGITAGMFGGLGGLLNFGTGGIVPGPIGAPVLATVHGGERITSAVEAAITLDLRGAHIYGQIAFEDAIRRVLRDTILSGGGRGVLSHA